MSQEPVRFDFESNRALPLTGNSVVIYVNKSGLLMNVLACESVSRAIQKFTLLQVGGSISISGYYNPASGIGVALPYGNDTDSLLRCLLSLTEVVLTEER